MALGIFILIIFSVLPGFEVLGEYTNCSKTMANNMTLKRLKRTTDLLGLEEPLPLPSEVLDNLFSRRLFNTTMNYIVPMFQVSLPVHTEDGMTIHLAMQVNTFFNIILYFTHPFYFVVGISWVVQCDCMDCNSCYSIYSHRYCSLWTKEA
jgi:hypothetical protein